MIVYEQRNARFVAYSDRWMQAREEVAHGARLLTKLDGGGAASHGEPCQFGVRETLLEVKIREDVEATDRHGGRVQGEGHQAKELQRYFLFFPLAFACPVIPPLSLYALDDELRQLEYELLDAGGEVDEETDARHTALLDAREDKVEAYLALIRRFETTAEAVKSERQRLQESERALANSAKRLKDRLCTSMRERDQVEHLTRLGKVRVQQASRRPVELLVEPDALPEAYMRVRTDADLSALAADLASEDPVVRAQAEAVAKLGEASYYVRIY